MSDTMLFYLLRGERNLQVGKAKIVANATNTDPMLWIDPTRALERKGAWYATFPKPPRKNARKTA